MRIALAVSFVCLSLVAAGCGGDNGGGTTACNGTLRFMTDISLTNTTFVMCASNFPSGEGSFDTLDDSENNPKTEISLVMTGVTTGTQDCNSSLGFVVKDPSYVDYQGMQIPLGSLGAGGSCTLSTTTISADHWMASATGMLVDVHCTSATSCTQETHNFSAGWDLHK